MKFLPCICTLIFLSFPFVDCFAQNPGCRDTLVIDDFVEPLGSTYVPVDSWIYPAVDRLHGLGYIDTAYLGMRPWTRLSIAHMLAETADKIDDAGDDEEACTIFHSLQRELKPDVEKLNGSRKPQVRLESVYTRLNGITGTPLRDSYHLGQTIINDYGRPYAEGFNNVTGFSAHGETGRFALYFRGEYQHAPGTPGYSNALSTLLSKNDGISFAASPNQATIPSGPIPAANNFRILEANVSYLLLNHEFSFGKSDHWLGPAQGGSFAWSNNAENIYAFQIDRVEPLYVPLLSKFTGPFRYQFFVGSLKGHTNPNAPWMHVEKISFRPTENLEFGFERTVIWGGKGHAPITLHTGVASLEVGEADAHDVAAGDLVAEAERMQHRAAVRHAQHLLDVDLAGLGIELDFREGHGEAGRDADAREIVLGDRDQAGAGDHIDTVLGHRVDVLGDLLAGVLAAELHRLLRRLRISDRLRGIGLADDFLVAEVVVGGSTAEHLGRDVEELLLHVGRGDKHGARLR